MFPREQTASPGRFVPIRVAGTPRPTSRKQTGGRSVSGKFLTETYDAAAAADVSAVDLAVHDADYAVAKLEPKN
jgi:hypothetical protein